MHKSQKKSKEKAQHTPRAFIAFEWIDEYAYCQEPSYTFVILKKELIIQGIRHYFEYVEEAD